MQDFMQVLRARLPPTLLAAHLRLQQPMRFFAETDLHAAFLVVRFLALRAFAIFVSPFHQAFASYAK